MKKQLFTFAVVLILVLIILLGVFYLKNEPDEYIVAQEDYLDHTLIQDIPESGLSNQETEGLMTMREEEKLAHDVYSYLYERWGLKIFNNISDSEQTHTDAVKALLDRYDVADPALGMEKGSFTNEELQSLYGQLVEQGEESIKDALFVGAMIEDLDIYDLLELIEQTDNEDIQIVYENLVRGSENHMHAFIKQLEGRDFIYEPQYITQEELNSILGQ